jgi:hypothetical protein
LPAAQAALFPSPPALFCSAPEAIPSP